MILLALSISLISCGGEDEDLGTNNGTGANSGSENLGPNDWLISVDEVNDGGPGKYGIPSIDAPVFISAAEATYMLEDELIVGVVALIFLLLLLLLAALVEWSYDDYGFVGLDAGRCWIRMKILNVKRRERIT